MIYLKRLILGKFIDRGCEGAVMESRIDGISFTLSIKMCFNYGISTTTYCRHNKEQEIMKVIPYHRNVNFLIHDFLSRPTKKLVSDCIQDKDVHKIMQIDDHKYRTSLFLIYKHQPSNLQKWMIEKRKNCPMTDIIRICYEISCGVLHLWNHGVVHRDLKLNNILIDDEGHIVIIDFGFAVIVNSDGKAEVDRLGGCIRGLAPEV